MQRLIFAPIRVRIVCCSADWPFEPCFPMRSQMAVHELDQARTQVRDEPMFCAIVQENSEMGENYQRLWLHVLEELDVSHWYCNEPILDGGPRRMCIAQGKRVEPVLEVFYRAPTHGLAYRFQMSLIQMIQEGIALVPGTRTATNVRYLPLAAAGESLLVLLREHRPRRPSYSMKPAVDLDRLREGINGQPEVMQSFDAHLKHGVVTQQPRKEEHW